MSNIERGVKPREDHSKTNNLKRSENDRDDLLSRRKFLKMSVGVGAMIAAGGVGVAGYGLERVSENAREVENEYPQPSAYEYANAVNEVEIYDKKENLYRQCQSLYTPKTCQVLRPKNTTEVQNARNTLERQNTYEKELHKLDRPWAVAGLFSAALTLGSVGRVIYSCIELSMVNRKIRQLCKSA